MAFRKGFDRLSQGAMTILKRGEPPGKTFLLEKWKWRERKFTDGKPPGTKFFEEKPPGRIFFDGKTRERKLSDGQPIAIFRPMISLSSMPFTSLAPPSPSFEPKSSLKPIISRSLLLHRDILRLKHLPIHSAAPLTGHISPPAHTPPVTPFDRALDRDRRDHFPSTAAETLDPDSYGIPSSSSSSSFLSDASMMFRQHTGMKEKSPPGQKDADYVYDRVLQDMNRLSRTIREKKTGIERNIEIEREIAREKKESRSEIQRDIEREKEIDLEMRIRNRNRAEEIKTEIEKKMDKSLKEHDPDQLPAMNLFSPSSSMKINPRLARMLKNFDMVLNSFKPVMVPQTGEDAVGEVRREHRPVPGQKTFETGRNGTPFDSNRIDSRHTDIHHTEKVRRHIRDINHIHHIHHVEDVHRVDRTSHVSQGKTERQGSESSPIPPKTDFDLNRITDQVYQMLERKIKFERERRGL